MPAPLVPPSSPGPSVADVLGPGGAVARALGDGYEPRPEQIDMAAAVAATFADADAAIDAGAPGPPPLMVEAGTGVGKSFAYLVPALDAARRGRRVVVSTHTIALQEQLVEKDLPLLAGVMAEQFPDAYPTPIKVVLVKGRGNYLCRRRLEMAIRKGASLFPSARQARSLIALQQWAERIERDGADGSLAPVPELDDPAAWDKARAEAGNCLGKRCPHYKGCHWQSARRRMNAGQILVVNHALFFSDLALRMAGVHYLPPYDHAIFDEAHTLEDVAAGHFGIRLAEGSVTYPLRQLYDGSRGKGLLTSSGLGESANPAIESAVRAADAAEGFFGRCAAWSDSIGGRHGRVRSPGFVANDLSPALDDAAARVRAVLASLAESPEERSELSAAADRLASLSASASAMVDQTIPEAAYWVEVAGRSPRRVTLHAAPVSVADGLRRHLFEQVKGVVLTSATLCTGAASGGSSAARSVASAVPLPAERGEGVPPSSLSADALVIRQGRCLPHWTRTGSAYAVTFRLVDSLPAGVVDAYRRERERLLGRIGDRQRPTAEDGKLLDRLFSDRIESYLDAGHGACWLGDGRVARIVSDGLAHFAGDRYERIAWVLMPNHVHLVLRPAVGHGLPEIMHSLKSYTAKQANRALRRTGAFWQSEYYDHLIRDADDYANQVRYVEQNPTAAGLKDWAWVSTRTVPMEGAGIAEHRRGQDARATCVPTLKAINRPVPLQIDPAFAYLAGRLGVPAPRTLRVGSPFDYAAQATLYLETGLPDPADPAFLDAAGERILHYLRLTGGGAFVLFTSYKMLIEAANLLHGRIADLGLPLLVQGQGQPRGRLLDRFRAEDGAVLFGTASFWQGVDVRGERLRNVIIPKLPFAVPGEPLTEARGEAVAAAGGNAFADLSLPEAVIRLKQGVGRLIRSRADRGIVVLLDPRVRTKSYGRAFLNALPPMRIGGLEEARE